ncbi:MAG: tRNA lysidine(34) synthetase TilS [Candidatus Kapaibacteriales bacterium]
MIREKKNSKKIRKIYPSKENSFKATGEKVVDEYVDNFLSRLLTFLQQKLFVDCERKIVIGVSGGVDSVVLLDALSLLSRRTNYNLAVAHLNHQIRGTEAEEDEKFVISLANYYGWLCYVQKVNIPYLAKQQKINLENLARSIRYDFFRRVCQSFNCAFIATAHTMDDQAETLLLNLIRGTGVRGLRGIDAKRKINEKTTLIRPLLIFQKDEVIQYAHHRNLKWREDLTNLLETYTRNKIRRKLIPLLKESFNPRIVKTLSRTSEIAKSYQKIISHFIESTYNKCVFRRNSGEIEVRISLLQHLEKYVVTELFQEILYRNFELILNYEKIEPIIDLIFAESGKGFLMTQDIVTYKDRDKIFIVKQDFKSANEILSSKVGKVLIGKYLIELDKVPREDFVKIPSREIEFFDFDKIPEQVSFRFWRKGDKFSPLGMKSEMKVSDLFINLKIPLHQKHQIPLMIGNDEIIWVCGVQINEKYKVTPKTKQLLCGKILNR